MKTIVQHQPRLIALLLLAGTIGLVLLMLAVAPQEGCSENKSVGILKLI